MGNSIVTKALPSKNPGEWDNYTCNGVMEEKKEVAVFCTWQYKLYTYILFKKIFY